MKPLRSALSGALLLALALPAAADAATYTMRASVPGMITPVPKQPAYNKIIDPSSFTGYWSHSKLVAEYGWFSDWISALNYAVSVAGLDEAQWGARERNTPCAGVGEYHDYFSNVLVSAHYMEIHVYRQLCAATMHQSIPNQTITSTKLTNATVPTPAGWGVWGSPSLKIKHLSVHKDNIPGFILSELGINPAQSMEMMVGSACKHIGESRDYVVASTYYTYNTVYVHTQTCNPQ